LVAQAEIDIVALDAEQLMLEQREQKTRQEMCAVADSFYDAVMTAHSAAAIEKLAAEEDRLKRTLDECQLELTQARATFAAANAKRTIESIEIEVAANAAAEETQTLTAQLDMLRRQKLEIQIELKERHMFTKLLAQRDQLENEYFAKLCVNPATGKSERERERERGDGDSDRDRDRLKLKRRSALLERDDDN
jgi:hypothetical protein